MSEIRNEMRFRVDLSAPLVTQNVQTVLQQGDKGANVITAEVYDGGSAVNLVGLTADGWMMTDAGEKTALSGRVSGNTATLPLTEECYRSAGGYTAIMRLKNADGVKRTILRIAGQIEPEGGE